MPEPGQTPQPQIKQGQGPDALPWGQAAQVNDLVGLVPPEPQPYQPSGAADQFLYSPTDRPNEPFSAGSAFGAGPSATPQPQESDTSFTQRIASQAVNDPAAPKEMKQFAQRALNGM